MILEIRLENFYSIDEEIVLDMRAGNLRSKKSKDLESNTIDWKNDKVLKSVAFFGANASGKSNIIKAIRYCCQLIFNSHNFNDDAVFRYRKFKFSSDNKPSNFYINFVHEKIEYEYSFSLGQDHIISESLYHYPKGKRAKVFERNENNGDLKSDIYSYGSAIKKPHDVAINTSNKTLYVSRASQLDRDVPKKVFNYFHSKFILKYLDKSPQAIKHYILNYKEFILTGLKIADSDIIDIGVNIEKVNTKYLGLILDEDGKESVKINDEERDFLKIHTFHKRDPNVKFDLETEESSGTQKLFYILVNVIDIIVNNKVLIIDELDESLHTKLVQLVVSYFHYSDESQLIFSTHDTNLIDFDLLRRDQIYFVNKREDSSTELYSLYDYKDFRENMDPEKGYLQGRFDALPILDNSSSFIKSMIDKRSD